MVEGGESEKKKYFCLHCGSIFESEKDAPYCPNCRRKRVIPLELLGSSIEKHRDKLKELGVLPEPDPEPQDSEPQETAVEGEVEAKDFGTSKLEPEAERKVEESELEPVKEPRNSEPKDSSYDVSKSDKLLAKYLEELEDFPEKPKPKKPRPKKPKRSITVPVGPSLIEVLIVLGAIVLLWKWWTSKSSKSDDESNVPRSSETYYQIQRNLGHHVLG